MSRLVAMLGLSLVALFVPAVPAFAGDVVLQAPAGFPLLGVSCGGVHVSTYATDFQTDENGASLGVVGEVYAWTRCGSSGVGGGYTTRTYKKWVLASWDMAGHLISTFAWTGPLPVSPSAEYLRLKDGATDTAGDMIWTDSIMTSYGTAYVAKLRTP